jgi:STE24 endopeptidase
VGLITMLVSLAFALSLVLTPWWRGLGKRAPFMVAIVLWAIDVALGLPRALFAWYQRDAWSMSEQSLGDFLGQLALEQILSGVLWVGAVVIVARVAKRAPRRGPAVLAVAFAAFVVVMQVIQPLVVAPLFNDFTPIEQSPFASQAPRIRALVAQAGLPVTQLLVMDGSRQGEEGNAYVTGLFGSERVVLFDTILAYPPQEVDSIVGHELGHWAHGDIWRGTAAGALAAALMPFFLFFLLRRNPGISIAFVLYALDTAADPLTTPLWSVFSRHQEAAADAFAMDLTHDPATFAGDERRLALESFSDLVPHPVRMLVASHPHTVERIEAACARDPSVCAQHRAPTEVRVSIPAERAADAANAFAGPQPVRGTWFAATVSDGAVVATVNQEDADVARRVIARVLRHHGVPAEQDQKR